MPNLDAKMAVPWSNAEHADPIEDLVGLWTMARERYGFAFSVLRIHPDLLIDIFRAKKTKELAEAFTAWHSELRNKQGANLLAGLLSVRLEKPLETLPITIKLDPEMPPHLAKWEFPEDHASLSL